MNKIDNNGKNGLLITRVSTAEQAKKGASLESQENWGKNLASSMGVQIVENIKSSMSGEIFPKENYEKILNAIEKKCINYVFVYAIDRLSRNLPWGSKLIQDLWDGGVQLVTSTMIPDLNNSSDRMQTWITLLAAEMGFEDIHEKTSRGILTKLSRGEYFYKNPPFGYELVDLRIFVKEEYKPVIALIFNTFIQKRSYSATARIVNNFYKDSIISSFSASQIKKIIQNKIYIGYFTWNGRVLGVDGDDKKPREELIAIDNEIFYKAQQMVQALDKKYSRNDVTNLVSLFKWYDEYGPAFILDNCENLVVSCPQCRSVNLICNGKEIYSGALVMKYKCKNCQHQFRFPSGKQLKIIRTLKPLRCMNCGVPDHFNISNSHLTDYDKLICKECSFEVHIKKD